MIRDMRLLAASALAGLLIAGALTLGARAGQDILRSLLPADGAAPGWSRDGEPQEYAGEDLYAYIDGGAEIYQEYGFRRIILQDYKNASGKSVSLEIFEMETPAAAYGMFTFKRSGSGKSVTVGAGDELESYYLNFWKGRFLVTLTGFDGSADTIDGLKALAGSVDTRLPAGGEVPQLVAALPWEGLHADNVKYFKGLLGLGNVYSFGTARGLGFKEAAKGTYDNGATLLILQYASAEDRSSAWLELGAFLERSDRFIAQGHGDTGQRLFRDGKGRFIAFAESGPRLVIGIGPDAALSLETVGRVR
jgi:hypothetical protein